MVEIILPFSSHISLYRLKKGLDTLFRITFESIQEIATVIERIDADIKRVACYLTGATELVMLLMKLRFGIDDANFALLRGHFAPDVRLS